MPTEMAAGCWVCCEYHSLGDRGREVTVESRWSSGSVWRQEKVGTVWERPRVLPRREARLGGSSALHRP